ncbi:MAG: DUF4129 domain-containing protein [Thermomicrobiales bacterium]
MRMRALLLLALCGLALGFLPLTARAADVDLPTYVQRLTTAQDALIHAQALAGAPRDAAIQRARDALADIDGVTVDGTQYPASHAEALAALRRSPPDTERAGTQLAALRSLLADAQVAVPDAQARQKLATVLSDRAFHEAEPNLVQKQAIRLQSWIGEQLRRLFQPLARTRTPTVPPGTPSAGPLARALSLLGSPALLTLIALLIATAIIILRLRWGRKRAKRAADEEVIPPRTAAEWRQHADMLALRGEYRAAVRALFLGTLTELDERRLVAFDPALTDREYLREAQRQQAWLIEPLRPFVRLVEAVVYADAPCRAAEYDRARAFTDDVRRLITAPQGVAG